MCTCKLAAIRSAHMHRNFCFVLFCRFFFCSGVTYARVRVQCLALYCGRFDSYADATRFCGRKRETTPFEASNMFWFRSLMKITTLNTFAFVSVLPCCATHAHSQSPVYLCLENSYRNFIICIEFYYLSIMLLLMFVFNSIRFSVVDVQKFSYFFFKDFFHFIH